MKIVINKLDITNNLEDYNKEIKWMVINTENKLTKNMISKHQVRK